MRPINPLVKVPDVV